MSLERTPFSFSEDPHEYNPAKQVDSDIFICSYGAVGLDEELIGLDYFQDIIPKITPYHNLQHIGFTNDSVVFKIHWLCPEGMVQTGVLKCIYDFTCTYESVCYEYLSQGKSIQEIGYIETEEIALLKQSFLHQNDHWCEPLDMFYILELRKTLVKRWFCVVLPFYQDTFYSIDLKTVSIRKRKKIMLQLARAVHSLHSIGFCHGDLKPKNICIESSGHVRLIDFGTSYHTDHVNSFNSFKYIRNTYGYFSPIQAFNHLAQDSIPRIMDGFPKSLLHDLKEALGLQGISVHLYVNPNMDHPISYIPEHGFSNDLFVIGLLMSFLFDTTHGHFFLKGYSNIEDNSFEWIIRNVIEFTRDPKAYIKDYYKQVSFPIFLKPVFEFCIGQWNVHPERVTLSNTSEQLVKMLSVL